jgi:hypothetical protein
MRTSRVPALRDEFELCSDHLKSSPFQRQLALLWTHLVNGNLHSVRNDMLVTRPPFGVQRGMNEMTLQTDWQWVSSVSRTLRQQACLHDLSS